ncbi:hypothetical protein [Kitasatospora kifunensis]|uniref:Uncharacterized protein n=1 Tax=Kitasatospora kifunensis TaxID=58351 RepID=A0A7W7VYY5_KITKI|nr:hypothetical protein [Kitasatospora kifunensis]MBB4928006.1 hypothetical protein [Kitasatospora kifunensis]
MTLQFAGPIPSGRTATTKATASSGDRLLAIRVLRRGLLLNCARCHFEAFYRVEQVGSFFDCLACGHTSAMARGRWYKKDPEPH